MEKRCSFENFKSSICHRVKNSGDMNFIADTLESGDIRRYYEAKWYRESLYLLAMLDYLSRENNLPICTNYNDIRRAKLAEVIYPAGILVRCSVMQSEQPKIESYNNSIPEFKRFNIVENEVRNVW